MNKHETPPGASRNSRSKASRDRSWSLLMVGDHGQIIPFRRVKGIAIALTTLATLAILAAVGLGFWGAWLRVQNAGLQTELKAVQDSVRRLKDEKDLLMAKVVILESHSQEGVSTTKRIKDAKGSVAATGTAETKVAEKAVTTAAKPAKDAAPMAKTKPAQKRRPASQTSPTAATPKTPSPPTTVVAVSGFMADHRPRNNALSARFQIKNIGARGQRVSGRCVLVLKNAVKSDMEWVSVPHVSLISGRPNGKQGRVFRIANFMTLKMQTEKVPDNFAFDTGTLYVFDDTGKQLLEKEVPVQLSYRKPAPAPEPAPTPAATETRVAPIQAPPASSDPLPAPAGQAPDPASTNEAAPGGPDRPDNMKPAPTPAPLPAAPAVPSTDGPSTETPQRAQSPVEASAPTAPVPADVGDDPALMTGSEATPSTAPPEPSPEDSR